MCPPKAWGQGPFEAPHPPWEHHCCLLTSCSLLAHHLLTLIWPRKGVLLIASMPPNVPSGAGMPQDPLLQRGLRPLERDLDALPAHRRFYLISLLQSQQY